MTSQFHILLNLYSFDNHVLLFTKLECLVPYIMEGTVFVNARFTAVIVTDVLYHWLLPHMSCIYTVLTQTLTNGHLL